MGLSLLPEPEYDESRMLLRRVGTDVGKVCIRRNQGPHFLLAHRRYIRVRLASHALLENRDGVVPGLTQQGSHFDGKIFVHLEPHAGLNLILRLDCTLDGTLRWKGHDALSGQIGGVGERSMDRL